MWGHFALHRLGATPLWRQVHAHLRDAIENGALPCGARLPSTRALARRLLVSRNTVLEAYDELISDGLVEGRAGGGTKVSTRRRSTPLRSWDPAAVLRESQMPVFMESFRDPDGHVLFIRY